MKWISYCWSTITQRQHMCRPSLTVTVDCWRDSPGRLNFKFHPVKLQTQNVDRYCKHRHRSISTLIECNNTVIGLINAETESQHHQYFKSTLISPCIPVGSILSLKAWQKCLSFPVNPVFLPCSIIGHSNLSLDWFTHWSLKHIFVNRLTLSCLHHYDYYYD